MKRTRIMRAIRRLLGRERMLESVRRIYRLKMDEYELPGFCPHCADYRKNQKCREDYQTQPDREKCRKCWERRNFRKAEQVR